MLRPSNDTTIALEREYRAAGAALKALSGGGAFGLTPDAVRNTDAWKSAKRAYESAFQALRAHNSDRAKA